MHGVIPVVAFVLCGSVYQQYTVTVQINVCLFAYLYFRKATGQKLVSQLPPPQPTIPLSDLPVQYENCLFPCVSFSVTACGKFSLPFGNNHREVVCLFLMLHNRVHLFKYCESESVSLSVTACFCDIHSCTFFFSICHNNSLYT